MGTPDLGTASAGRAALAKDAATGGFWIYEMGIPDLGTAAAGRAPSTLDCGA